MKRAMLMVAVAALFVAGSAVAQEDRSGGLIGSGTRTGDSGQVVGSGNAAGQTMGSGGFTTSTQDQWMGNGGRTDGQILGSGNAAGQVMGSGGFTASPQDSGVFMGSGGFTASPQDGGYLGNGGYLGSGLAVREVPLADGSSLLVVSSDAGTFVIPIAE